ncbi:hypothetical protein [Paenibacillus sp. N3.4]|uniref:hypothetical protein n=1 Tax=Paenibacillus sp. N3.4 TaxID=2603222 RepID=UPI0021C2AA33|nr:hypothetical protein [Paenibacillus sp. N3.4]
MARFSEQDITELRNLKIQCSHAVVEELTKRCSPKGDAATEGVISYYDQMLDRLRKFKLVTKRRDPNFDESRRELHWVAVQAEREAVQGLYEQGEISREAASRFRANIRNREATLYEQDEIG